MRLKKLILHGFKSFADRTEFLFESPITGIVGPNGCGKSNVVDGFKWVLGEQSAKSLRGDAMMDVIFNGSGGRKPAGMAEVVLVFDNPKRADDTRPLALDTDEVAVGRRLFRDGTSEYQLNNQTARLKDVRELFLDTGVGVDAYSVIEQGRVAALLEANPEERRMIFEEAAGISKYKVKKKEAQRKLERVDQNLLRVSDIIEEVQKQLRSVKVQAGRARTYQEHSARLAELRLTHSLREYHLHCHQLDALSSRQEDAQFRLDDAAGDLARRQNELAERREQFDSLSQTRQRLDYELVQTRASLQSAQQRQAYAQQQLEQIVEQLAAADQDRIAAEARLAETAAALESQSAELAQLTAEVESRRAQIDQQQQAFRDGQLALNQLNQQVEQDKAAVLDLMRQLASVNSRLASIEIERKNISAQQARLSERRRVVVEEIQAIESTRNQLITELDAVTNTLAQQAADMTALREQAQELGQTISVLSEQLGAAKEHRSGLLSREKLLKDLEARREGVSEGVKSVLRQRDQRFGFIRGLVADILRVDVEHAHVIEAALNGQDQTLVTADHAAALDAQSAFEELGGRVNVISTDCLPEFDDNYDWNRHPHPIRLAADLVRCDYADQPIAQHLLGRTIVLDDLTSANDLQANAPEGYRYVTLAGEVIEADGTLRAGPLAASMGLLSRKAELESIAAQIAEVDGRIERLSQQFAEGNATARAIEQQLNALRSASYQANTQKVELTSRIAQQADKLAQLAREQPLLDRELAALLDQTGNLTTQEQTLSARRTELDADQSARQQRIADSATRQQQIADELRTAGEALTSARVELGQLQEKHIAAGQGVQRQTAQVAELKQQIDRLARSTHNTASRRGEIETEQINARREQESLTEKQHELTSQTQGLAEQVTAAQQAVKTLVTDVDTFRERHAQLEEQMHDLQLKLGEQRVRLETLITRTADELQLDLPAHYAEIAQTYQPAELDWDAVAQEIKELRDKIQRLGNVNLDSIGEQKELEEREQFLTNQVTDLTASKRQLEELIDTINAESSTRFEQTFNAVREHFQGMFRKLFGGGKADIYLETELAESTPTPATGENAGSQPVAVKRIDPLDAGIEIIARPPGKQPVSISQLSGGEKTMTCVALLMSIFKSKPSPFCILDEVDAALDEANNQRFNLIVQEFLELSQFIIITHSKRTMQIADVLYGVTMQEQGVSKRVAVKFDQVDNQGRITSQVEVPEVEAPEAETAAA
jgi:chromosome segregation protein